MAPETRKTIRAVWTISRMAASKRATTSLALPSSSAGSATNNSNQIAPIQTIAALACSQRIASSSRSVAPTLAQQRVEQAQAGAARVGQQVRLIEQEDRSDQYQHQAADGVQGRQVPTDPGQ